MPNQETEQKRLIQEIRRKYELKYKIDTEDRGYQNSLEIISKDIYSKKNHFIFELIQNAEDNTYQERVTPRLSFNMFSPDPNSPLLKNGLLLVVNNETGFRTENVKALCSVGESQKKQNKQDNIGEKGIGFKSVFLVSAEPHIFSNSFQFKFDEKPDPEAGLGFIVPSWVDEIPLFLENYINETCILLPLKQGEYETVIKGLKDILPETILFLTKLRHLEVSLNGDSQVKVFKNRKNSHLVELKTYGVENSAEYWLKEKEFVVPKEKINEDKRKDITNRRVSIALPVKTIDQFKSSNSVFAYLPTEENSGLPFLINADFILNASRGELQKDLTWNKWLRDCIAPTLVEAFEEMLHDEHYKFDAYCFLPIEAQQNNPFFEPVKDQTWDLLKEKPELIWVITADGEEKLKSARQVRRATSALRKLLSSAKGLPAYFNQISLVHPNIEQYFRQLKVLGVGLLTENEILEFLKDEEWLNQQSPSWFVELYKLLQGYSEINYDKLKNHKIILLEDGTLTAPINQNIYLPVKEDIAKVAEISKQLETTQSKLALLNHIIFESVKNDVKILDYLQKYLLIKNLTLPNYSIELIKHLKGLEFSKIVIITKFVRDNFDDFDKETKSQVKACNFLYGHKGSLTANPLINVMPANLDPETGWQLVFADEEDRSHLFILSNDYLNYSAKGNNRDEEAKKWTWFFKQLGVTDAPEMPLKELKVSSNLQEANSYEGSVLVEKFRSKFSSKFRVSQYNEVIQNYRPPNWLRDLEDNRQKTLESLTEKVIIKRAQALVKWIENQVSTNPVPRSFTSKYNAIYQQRPYSDSMDSEFKALIFSTSWFPSTQGLKRPQDVFVDNPTFRSLLGDAVPYSIKDVAQYFKAIFWLQLNQDAKPDNLIRYLKNLSKEIPNQSMLKQVEKIFRFLSNTSDSSLYHYFLGEKIILVSNPALKWVGLSDVIWPDLSGIFGDTYSYLGVDYKDLRNFFVGKLNVKAEVDTQQYADALRKMWSTTTDAAKVEKVLERIYPRLKEEAAKVEKPTWWWELCRDIRVWTKSDKFVAPNQVYIQDDPELEKLFTKQGVEFVWRPEKSSLAEYKQLYTIFGIKSLVEQVELELVDCSLDNSFSENQYLTSYTKKMICYYLWNEHKEVYERLKNDPNLLPALLKTKEQEVENLRIAYKLARKRVEIPESLVYWDLGQNLLYVNTSSEPKVDIPIEIARKLIRANNLGDVKKDALEDFIGSKLSMSEQVFKRNFEKKDYTLPEEERAWIESLLGAANKVVEQTEQNFTESNENLFTEDVIQEDDSLTKSPIQTFTLAVSENGGIVQPTHKTAFDISRPIQSSVGSSTNHSGTAGHKSSSDTASYYNSGKSTDSSSSVSTYISSSPTTKDITEPKINNNGEVARISNLAQSNNPIGKRPVLRSYVLPSNSSLEGTIDEENEISEEERNQIDRKGIEKVLEYERNNGRSPEELEHNHPGWDINSYEVNENGERGKCVRHIEVKSTKYNWDGYGVGISSTQFEKAWELGDDYYLYVVESILDEQNFKLTVIRNPVELITNYRFDGGWKGFASERFSPDEEAYQVAKNTVHL